MKSSGDPPAILQWHVLTGCTPISVGCANCYAMRQAGGIFKDKEEYVALTKAVDARSIWTGEIRFNKTALELPRHHEPQRIYVAPHSDIFHPAVKRDWHNAIFRVIISNPQHTYIVLTKRPGDMMAYVNERYPSGLPKNVHVGTSAERQIEADSRIPALINTKAVVRFVMFYPLLGPIDCRRFLWSQSISYVAAGAEAERPAQAEWFETIQRDCKAYKIAYQSCDRTLECV